MMITFWFTSKKDYLNFSNRKISYDWDLSIFLIIFGFVKNRQVTHRSYMLSYFLRELWIESGAIIEKYFNEEFTWNPWNFKELNEEFKDENNVYS
jgi:hypothetical protein